MGKKTKRTTPKAATKARTGASTMKRPTAKTATVKTNKGIVRAE